MKLTALSTLAVVASLLALPAFAADAPSTTAAKTDSKASAPVQKTKKAPSHKVSKTAKKAAKCK